MWACVNTEPKLCFGLNNHFSLVAIYSMAIVVHTQNNISCIRAFLISCHSIFISTPPCVSPTISCKRHQYLHMHTLAKLAIEKPPFFRRLNPEGTEWQMEREDSNFQLNQHFSPHYKQIVIAVKIKWVNYLQFHSLLKIAMQLNLHHYKVYYFKLFWIQTFWIAQTELLLFRQNISWRKLHSFSVFCFVFFFICLFLSTPDY